LLLEFGPGRPRDLAGYGAIMFQVFQRIRQERSVLLQKAMYLHARFEPEQLANIGFRHPITPVAFKRKGFQSGSPKVLPGRGKGGSQIVWNLHRNIHRSLLTLSITVFRPVRTYPLQSVDICLFPR
jgi:hypothetical protein